MKALRLLFMIVGLLALATSATNAYLSDQAEITNNQFTADTWEN